MPNWKRAITFGSLGAATALFLAGKKPAGAALAGLGVAVLVLDNRERATSLWRELPQWLDRTSEIVSSLADLGERLLEQRAARDGHAAGL
jgi:hypothetical protein